MFSVNLYTLKICGLFFTLLALVIVTAGSTPVLAAQQRLMVYGDSLVAGYGLSSGEGFPEQLQQALTAAGRDVKVLNAGVSGDTTAGGLARLDWALSDQAGRISLSWCVDRSGDEDHLRAIQKQPHYRASIVRLLMHQEGLIRRYHPKP